MGLNFVKDYVRGLIEQGESGADIASKLKVSVSMVSSYKLHSYNPSITVAKIVYATDGIVLHPFSKESLEWEISNDIR